MKPAYSCCGAIGLIPSNTWRSFIRDSVSKIITDANDVKPHTTINILIFCHDFNLIGRTYDNTKPLENSIVEFQKYLANSSLTKSLRIKLICCNLHRSTNSISYDHNIQIELLQQFIHKINIQYFSHISKIFNLEMIDNIKIYYEYEIRQLISSLIPVMEMSLEFTNSKFDSAILNVDLVACTLHHFDIPQEGFKRPQILCTIPRSGIDPICK